MCSPILGDFLVFFSADHITDKPPKSKSTKYLMIHIEEPDVEPIAALDQVILEPLPDQSWAATGS